MVKSFETVIALWLTAIAFPAAVIAQIHCPVVGDTVTITGQVSVVQENGTDVPYLSPKVFPNKPQPICVRVEPYIGAGVGRVDRVDGHVSHIWLVFPKQPDANGNDKTHSQPIATNTFLEVTGKLMGQRQEQDQFPEVTLEVGNIKNVDVEVASALDAWTNDCVKWLQAQVATLNAMHGQKAELNRYPRRLANVSDVQPFATVNGTPYPECAASILVQDAKGLHGTSIARLPWLVNNIGTISPPE